MARRWTFLILFVGFAISAAPQKLAVVEFNQRDIERILLDKVKSPAGQLLIETDVRLFSETPELAFPKSLAIEIPEDYRDDAQYAVTHGYFSVPLPVEKVTSTSFWSFQQLAKILPEYQFAAERNLSNGSDGAVAVPVGFTFGLAPSHLECKVQVRLSPGGSGPSTKLKVHPDWGQPVATVYQLNSGCNMFFSSFLAVSSIYKLADGTAGVFSQNFLYVRNSAIEKLNKVRFIAGPPGKAIGDKIKEQTITLAKALRKLGATESKK